MKDLLMQTGRYLSSMLLILSACMSAAVVLPAQFPLVVEDVLLNDTSIYLITGKTWHFYQGYNFTIKSVNQESDSVWVELSLGDKILQSQILAEGDNFIYQKNDKTILNLTVNTIYIGDNEELVAFSPVFQYIDSTLPRPFIPEKEINETENESSLHNDSRGINEIESFRWAISLLLIVLTAILILIFKKDKA